VADPGAGRTAPPAAIVIFGASGDLAARKLLPALYNLSVRGKVHPSTAIVGVARSDLGDDGFRERAAGACAEASGEEGLDREAWHELAAGMRYVRGGYDEPDTFRRLGEVLAELDEHQGTSGNRLYYLSTPPGVFAGVVRCLGDEGLHRPGPGGDFARVVIEKPFGTDLASAEQLDHDLHQVLEEDQVYRIDHYLGKETVQNVLALRFSNAIFEPLWNRRYLDSVQITVAESAGVGHRAGFYDAAGALRDIVQNHVLQVLALTAMEPPASMTPERIRDEKVKALDAVDILSVDEVAHDVVRGRYTAGTVGGDDVGGYLDEPDVPADSTTETFVAMRLRIDNWRWAGVPFYVRAGKRLQTRTTQVVLQYRDVPHLPFAPVQATELGANALVLRIQPDEGINLCFGAKVPGPAFDVRSVSMDMTYDSTFDERAAEAYERLLLDALVGDPTLFIRSDEVLQAWRVTQPLLDAWADDTEPPPSYEAGTWGPPAARQLLERDGRRWREP
jgi:glucose-6-phosphate 1-dehydrogenase